MRLIKFIIIAVLILVNTKSFNRESFSPNQEIKDKTTELYKNKELFTHDAKFTKIKSVINWIDPVIYDDVYTLALTEKLTISNLENTLSNSIY
jgi:hypothetical protein